MVWESGHSLNRPVVDPFLLPGFQVWMDLILAAVVISKISNVLYQEIPGQGSFEKLNPVFCSVPNISKMRNLTFVR